MDSQSPPPHSPQDTYRRALKAVLSHESVLRTREEALSMKGVGERIAGMIVKGNEEWNEGREKENLTQSHNGSGNVQVEGPVAAAVDVNVDYNDNVGDYDDDDDGSGSDDGSVSIAASSLVSSSERRSGRDASRAYVRDEGEPKYAVNLRRAVDEHAASLRCKVLSRSLVCFIDKREKEAKWMQSTLLQSGVKAEVRVLEIGDVTWVVRCELEDPDEAGKTWEYEYHMGHTIERKSILDLKESIMSKRFREQRLGLSRMRGKAYYLIEGVGSGMGHARDTVRLGGC